MEDTLAVLGPVVIPVERREIYKTIGGVPHLDGSVTIFGEVVEGFDIVEKISVVKTDKNDRPLHDVMINRRRFSRNNNNAYYKEVTMPIVSSL